MGLYSNKILKLFSRNNFFMFYMNKVPQIRVSRTNHYCDIPGKEERNRYIIFISVTKQQQDIWKLLDHVGKVQVGLPKKNDTSVNPLKSLSKQ